jgi:hypothetical protein
MSSLPFHNLLILLTPLLSISSPKTINSTYHVGGTFDVAIDQLLRREGSCRLRPAHGYETTRSIDDSFHRHPAEYDVASHPPAVVVVVVVAVVYDDLLPAILLQ